MKSALSGVIVTLAPVSTTIIAVVGKKVTGNALSGSAKRPMKLGACVAGSEREPFGVAG
jgi:hypothetical protein